MEPIESKPAPLQRVVILGASDKPDRYSHRAFTMLRRLGYDAVPVNPRLREIDGIPVKETLEDVEGPVGTLSLYVSPSISEPLCEKILSLRPGRVVFNPGTESTMLGERLAAARIPFVEACTLVLLETGQF